MAKKILVMPSLSPTMEEGILQSWAKAIGDRVAAGEVLANIETDKAVVEYEALDDGYLRHFFVEPGKPTRVGEPIAVIADSMHEDVGTLIEQGKQKNAAKVVPMDQNPGRDSQAGAAIAREVEAIAPPPPELPQPQAEEEETGE